MGDVNKGAALVTGGAQRLGAAMVRELARRGMPVAIHYNASGEAAEALAEEINASGGQAVTVQADLLERPQVAGLMDAAREKLGQDLTVLVNNASIFEYELLASTTHTSWDRHMGSNLEAPFFLAQAFAAQAPDLGDDGQPLARAQIINIIDMRVWRLTPNYTSYTLAKSALLTFTRTAAMALAPAIRVNAIGPGTTLQGTHQDKENFDAQRRRAILRRGADLEDIVQAFGYLLDAKAVTGQMLAVDGGQHLIWELPELD